MAMHVSLGAPRTRVRRSLIPASGDLQAWKPAQCVQIDLRYACHTPADRVHPDLDRAPYHDGAPVRVVAG